MVVTIESYKPFNIYLGGGDGSPPEAFRHWIIPRNKGFMAWVSLSYIDPLDDFAGSDSVFVDMPWLQPLDEPVEFNRWLYTDAHAPAPVHAENPKYKWRSPFAWGGPLGPEGTRFNYYGGMIGSVFAGRADVDRRLYIRLRKAGDQDVRLAATGMLLIFT
jgi:hypothetical protein